MSVAKLHVWDRCHLPADLSLIRHCEQQGLGDLQRAAGLEARATSLVRVAFIAARTSDVAGVQGQRKKGGHGPH